MFNDSFRDTNYRKESLRTKVRARSVSDLQIFIKYYFFGFFLGIIEFIKLKKHWRGQ